MDRNWHAVDYDQLEKSGPGEYIAEASDLGLAPGQWPTRILVVSGRVTTFYKRPRRSTASAVCYTADIDDRNEVELLVLND